MKKVLFIAVTLVTLIGLSGCVENSGKYKALQAKLDSLQVNYNVQGAELDEIFGTLNEIEAGLSSIRESENILAVQTHDGVEIKGSKEQLKEDVQAIQEAIKNYQKEIKKLQNDNRMQSAQFKKRLAAVKQ